MPKGITPKKHNFRGYNSSVKYKRHSDFKKGQVVAFYKVGKSQRDIEKLTKIPRSIVKNIIKAFNENGNVKRRPGSGRKRKTSKRQNKAIVKVSKDYPFMSAPEISDKVKLDYDIDVSHDTVNRRLNEVGLSS